MPRRLRWSKLARWSARAAAVAWLLLVGVLWVRSLYVTDYAGISYWANAEDKLVRFGFDVHLGRGELGLSQGHAIYPIGGNEDLAAEPAAWRPYWKVDEKPTRPPFHARPERWFDALGFGTDQTVSWRQRQVGAIVPFWLLMLPAAAVAIRWAGRARRAHRRRLLVAAGRCGNCGYDLRATPGRCPECGTEAGP